MSVIAVPLTHGNWKRVGGLWCSNSPFNFKLIFLITFILNWKNIPFILGQDKFYWGQIKMLPLIKLKWIRVFNNIHLGWYCSGCEWSSDITGKGYLVNPRIRGSNLVTWYKFTYNIILFQTKHHTWTVRLGTRWWKWNAPLLGRLIWSVSILFLLLLSIYITPNTAPEKYLHMIRYCPEWWEFITYDGLKYHVNVTEGLKVFPG